MSETNNNENGVSLDSYILLAVCALPIMGGVINLLFHLSSGEYESSMVQRYNGTYILIFSIIGVICAISVVSELASRIRNGKGTYGFTFRDVVLKEKWMAAFGVFVVWAFVSTFAAADPVTAFKGTNYKFEGYCTILIYAAVFMCAYLLEDAQVLGKLLKLILVVGDFTAIAMLAGIYNVPILHNLSTGKATSVFINYEHYGSAAVVFIACIWGLYIEALKEKGIKDKYTLVLLGSFLINIFAIVKDGNIGVFFAMLVMLVVFPILWKKNETKMGISWFIPHIIVVVFLVMAEVGVISVIGAGYIPRIREWIGGLFAIVGGKEFILQYGMVQSEAWISCLDSIASFPFVGTGPECLYVSFGTAGMTDTAYNEFLQCAGMYGIPGLVAYVAGLIMLIRCAVGKIKTAGSELGIMTGMVISYLACAFWSNSMYYTSIYLFLALGFIARECKSERIIYEPVAKPELTFEEKLSLKAAKCLQWWCIVPLFMAAGYAHINQRLYGQDIKIQSADQMIYCYICISIIGIISVANFAGILRREKANGSKLGSVLKQKSKNEVWIILLLALLTWSFISAIQSETVITAFIGTSLKRDGFFAYVMYAAVIGLGYHVVSNGHFKKVMNTMVIVANVLVFIMMGYEWGLGLICYMSHVFSSVYFLNPNHYGYFVCMGLMLTFGLFCESVYLDGNTDDKKNRKVIFYLLSFTWQMYGLMINNTMGAYVAVCLAMLVVIVWWTINKKKFSGMLLIPIAITIVITALSYVGIITNVWGETIGSSLNDLIADIFHVTRHDEKFKSAGSGRIALWLGALDAIAQKPIFGWGPEGLTGAYQKAYVFDRPHNEYLQWAAFCGVPALIMYLSAIIVLCVNRCRNLMKLSETTLISAGVVLGYLISAFFGFTTYYTTPYFCIFLGFVMGSVREANSIKASKSKKVEE